MTTRKLIDWGKVKHLWMTTDLSQKLIATRLGHKQSSLSYYFIEHSTEDWVIEGKARRKRNGCAW